MRMHNHQVSHIPAMSSAGILGSCSWQGAVSIPRAVPSQAQHPQPSPSFSPWLCPGGLTATAAWRQQPLNPGVYPALKPPSLHPPSLQVMLAECQEQLLNLWIWETGQTRNYDRQAFRREAEFLNVHLLK